MKASEYQISKDKFVFVNNNEKIHDKELVTKPVSYLKDAFNRFKKNKASIIAAIIIAILVLFSIVGPWTTPYSVAYQDEYYAYCLPKSKISEALNLNFWDGCKKVSLSKESFYYYYGIGEETNNNAIKNQEFEKVTELYFGKKTTAYSFRYDTYNAVGLKFISVSEEEYQQIQKYQNETGIQVIYPITDPKLRPQMERDKNDANFWYATSVVNGSTAATVEVDSKGAPTFQNIYLGYTGTDPYNSLRIEGDTPLYDYSYPNQSGYQIRVSYKEYYTYHHSYILKDGIKEACYVFGGTEAGKDIYTCLASGARFSFLLAVVVATINLIVGAIYGAIEGYYGGKIDLVMERISDILSSIPFMIVITLLKFHMEGSSQILILFISFFLTGWIGMAARTRMQFYRFKNQEYVLAARTLGAGDRRIMFKHIFPNAIGTLVTGCVLVIPGVIFSETSLSYLGIINLESGNLTSVGTLLSKGQQYLMQYPHMIVPPAIFICLLMLSFNLFGNGLRDAFNPSLRGSED